MNTLNGLMVLGLFLWSVSFGVLVIGTYLIYQNRKKPNSRRDVNLPDVVLPPISILKPLKGADPALYDNLKSFFELNYPHFEILFSAEESDDPALDVVRALIKKYPKVVASITVSKKKIGLNPKINNLSSTYHLARFDWLWLSDSNVQVEPNILLKMTKNIADDVGMIFGVVAGKKYQGQASELESLHLNTTCSRATRTLAELGIYCVMGKSMLFSRSKAQKWGGLLSLADYLAEDYLSGVKVEAAGLKVVVQDELIEQTVGQINYSTYVARHVRWGRLRKSINPLAFLLEIFFSSIVSALTGALVFQYFFQINPLVFAFCHLSVWLALDDLTHAILSGRQLTIKGWILKELSYVYVWWRVLLGNSVSWRGNHYRLGKNSKIIPIVNSQFKELASSI